MADVGEGTERDGRQRPKIVDASVWMRNFPCEIETDLLLRGIDVFDWHQGRMSSRRLLLLISVLLADEDSMLAKERRDGDWSESQYIAARAANEIMLLRADQAALHAGKRMDITLLQSPAQREEDDKMREKRDTARRDIMSQLKPKITE